MQSEITQVLGVDNLEGLDELVAVLLRDLPQIDPETVLTLSNSVWVNDSFKLDSSFEGLMSGDYASHVGYYDAANTSKAAEEINSWIASKTGDRITDFIKDPSTLKYLYALLVNAMYFQSEWGEKELFDPDDTVQATFRGSKGETQVQMMQSRETGLYAYGDKNLKYVKIPFGNGSYAMELVVPEKVETSTEEWQAICLSLEDIRKESGFEPVLKIRLPKFSVRGELPLNDALEAAGLKSLSDEVSLSMFMEACRGHMALRQESVLEIDEKGAEAAVVTANGIYVASGEKPRLREINIDRPFMFFITESSTGACVVSGRITDL